MRVTLLGTEEDQFLQLVNEQKEWNLTTFPRLKSNVVCRPLKNLNTLFKIDYTPVMESDNSAYWVNAVMLTDEETSSLMTRINLLEEVK